MITWHRYNVEFGVLTFVLLIAKCLCDRCYKYSSLSGYYTTYCSGYCSGLYGNEYCNYYYSYYYYYASSYYVISGGAIAGIAIGVLFMTAIVVAVVFFCVRGQTRRRTGTIITNPGQNPHVAVTHTTTTGYVQQQRPTGYPPPPAYGNVTQYPNMSAYPPPPTYSNTGSYGVTPSAPAFGYGNPVQPQYAPTYNAMPPPHM